MNAIIGLIRHVLTFGGGYFVATGQIDEVDVQEIVGALATLVGVVWSVINKHPGWFKKAQIPVILIPFLLVFTVVPPGCVTYPDGTTGIDPAAKTFLVNAAKVATLVGISVAGSEIPFLSPFLPTLKDGVYSVFAKSEDPKEIADGLKKLFQNTAIEAGNRELEDILVKYVSDELVSQTPAAGPGGKEQYQYNRAIVAGLE